LISTRTGRSTAFLLLSRLRRERQRNGADRWCGRRAPGRRRPWIAKGRGERVTHRQSRMQKLYQAGSSGTRVPRKLQVKRNQQGREALRGVHVMPAALAAAIDWLNLWRLGWPIDAFPLVAPGISDARAGYAYGSRVTTVGVCMSGCHQTASAAFTQGAIPFSRHAFCLEVRLSTIENKAFALQNQVDTHHFNRFDIIS
jgi:hypothetical protein